MLVEATLPPAFNCMKPNATCQWTTGYISLTSRDVGPMSVFNMEGRNRKRDNKKERTVLLDYDPVASN
jgi:hypothetical protein